MHSTKKNVYTDMYKPQSTIQIGTLKNSKEYSIISQPQRPQCVFLTESISLNSRQNHKKLFIQLAERNPIDSYLSQSE